MLSCFIYDEPGKAHNELLYIYTYTYTAYIQLCAAMLSCFVFDEPGEAQSELSQQNRKPLQDLKEKARRVATIQQESKLQVCAPACLFICTCVCVCVCVCVCNIHVYVFFSYTHAHTHKSLREKHLKEKARRRVAVVEPESSLKV